MAERIFRVKDEIGDVCITIDQGQTLHQFLLLELLSENTVVVDFEGVRIVAAPFLNHAFGMLISAIRPEVVNDFVRVVNLYEVGEDILIRVLDNAVEMRNNPGLRDAVTDIVSRYAEECIA